MNIMRYFLACLCLILISDTAQAVASDQKEEILDNFSVSAEFTVPKEKYGLYSAQLKEFDSAKLTALLFPSAPAQDIQTVNEETGTVITYRDSEIISAPGVLRYLADSQISNIKTLLDYGEQNYLLHEKELSFLSSDQAVHAGLSLLEHLEIGLDCEACSLYAVSRNDLYQIQETMRNDDVYRQLFEIGKYSMESFEDTEGIYCIKYRFSLNQIPVYGEYSPALRMIGGIDTPLLAQKIQADLLMDNSGIRYVSLYGVLDQNPEQLESEYPIGYDRIKNALTKKFGDVILTERYTVTEIVPEYLPIIDWKNESLIELTPVWCCLITIESVPDSSTIASGSDIALRFHCFTGEEMA